MTIKNDNNNTYSLTRKQIVKGSTSIALSAIPGIGGLLSKVFEGIDSVNQEAWTLSQFNRIDNELDKLGYVTSETQLNENIRKAIIKNTSLIYIELSEFKRDLYGNAVAYMLRNSDKVEWNKADFYMTIVDNLPDLSLVALIELMEWNKISNLHLHEFTTDSFKDFLKSHTDHSIEQRENLALALKQLESQGLVNRIDNSFKNTSGQYAYRLNTLAANIYEYIAEPK